MNKQTAVEWLWEQIDNTIPFQNIQTSQIFNGLLELAKAMEKEQIMDASGVGFTDGCLWSEGEEIYFKSPEHYYKETYGSNND